MDRNECPKWMLWCRINRLWIFKTKRIFSKSMFPTVFNWLNIQIICVRLITVKLVFQFVYSGYCLNLFIRFLNPINYTYYQFAGNVERCSNNFKSFFLPFAKIYEFLRKIWIKLELSALIIFFILILVSSFFLSSKQVFIHFFLLSKMSKIYAIYQTLILIEKLKWNLRNHQMPIQMDHKLIISSFSRISLIKFMICWRWSQR